MPSQSLLARSLAKKFAIATESSRDLKATMIMDLAKRGADVVLTYTSPSSEGRVDTIIAEIAWLSNRSRCITVCGDLRLDVPELIIRQTLEAFGHIGILVNNAAAELAKPMNEITAEDITSVYDLNVRVVHLLTQTVIPHLQTPGRIINISSVGARIGCRGLSMYCSSKVVVDGLMR